MIGHFVDRMAAMTSNNVDVEATIERVKLLIAEEKDLSPALKSRLEVLLLLVTILAQRFGLNSKNSHRLIPIGPRSRRIKVPVNRVGKKGETEPPCNR